MSNILGWEHDGHTFRIGSDDTPVLETPFAILRLAPPIFVGQDPDTGLPAYCPPPDNVATGSLPVPPTVMGDCIEMRCGAALAMTERLNGLYATWRTWINAALGVVLNVSVTLVLNWIAALIEGLILSARIASWWLDVFNRIKTPLSVVTLTELGSVLPAWDPTTVDNVQRTFFCALQCTSGEVSVSAGDMINVASFIRAHTAAFLGNIVSELLASIVESSTLADWQTAVSGASASTLCRGYTCV